LPFFKFDDVAGTRIVTLSRAPRNALTTELLLDGYDAFAALAVNLPENGVVITGEGKFFTAGMDMKFTATLDADGAESARTAINLFAAALHRLPCAVVSAINGHCIGAGGIMALATDWIIAADDDYRIGLPEAKAGLPFPPVAQIILNHGLGPVWRRRLALSSQLLSPSEAQNVGLADEIVPPAQLLEQAAKQARILNDQPGFAACKAQLRATANAEIDAILGPAG